LRHGLTSSHLMIESGCCQPPGRSNIVTEVIDKLVGDVSLLTKRLNSLEKEVGLFVQPTHAIQRALIEFQWEVRERFQKVDAAIEKLSATQTEHTTMLAGHTALLTEQGRLLAEHTALLKEILSRLPPQKVEI
jgi:hypothetical protein